MNFGKFEENTMAKISVKLDAFYESERNDIIEVEISEKELDALKGIGKKETGYASTTTSLLPSELVWT